MFLISQSDVGCNVRNATRCDSLGCNFLFQAVDILVLQVSTNYVLQFILFHSTEHINVLNNIFSSVHFYSFWIECDISKCFHILALY